MPTLTKRDVVPRIVLTLVTFGLYGLYWLKQITDDIHRLSGRQSCASGNTAAFYSFFSLTLYFFYWLYQISDELIEVRTSRGLPADGVKKGLYAATVIVMTFVAIALSIFQSVVTTSQIFSGADDESIAMLIIIALMASFGAFLIHSLISVGILWAIYKNKDENPRLIYVLMAIFRTHFLTIAFLQASLNDLADHENDGRMVEDSLFTA